MVLYKVIQNPLVFGKIDGIIKELDLQPCTHEPNLYYCCHYKGTHKTVLFLRHSKIRKLFASILVILRWDLI